MATTKNYKDYILEQLSLLDNISCKPMFGEYLLYYNNVLFGGIYDNKLLIKIVETNEKFNMQKEEPYKNAKLMYLVKITEDKEQLKEIVLDTYKSLL